MTNSIATDLESIFKYQTCQRCEDVVLSAVNEIEVLTLERDKARREVSELKANEANRLSSAVRLKGWICFEDNTDD